MSEWIDHGRWTNLDHPYCLASTRDEGGTYTWSILTRSTEIESEAEFETLKNCQESCEEAVVALMLIELAQRAAQWQLEMDAGMAREMRLAEEALQTSGLSHVPKYEGQDSEETNAHLRALTLLLRRWNKAHDNLIRGYRDST